MMNTDDIIEKMSDNLENRDTIADILDNPEKALKYLEERKTFHTYSIQTLNQQMQELEKKVEDSNDQELKHILQLLKDPNTLEQANSLLTQKVSSTISNMDYLLKSNTPTVIGLINEYR